LLDELEASGRKIIIRDLLKIMLSSRDHENKQSMRLITMLQIYRRDLMHTQIPGRWDKNYERCLAHMKPLLPNYPEPILKQRLYFLVPYLWTFLATQEDGGSQAHFWKEFWSDPSSMESLLDTAEGILVQPPSPDTLRALRLKTPPDAATALMRPARPRDARRSKAEPRSPDHARS
jgi:hypothetical protein